MKHRRIMAGLLAVNMIAGSILMDSTATYASSDGIYTIETLSEADDSGGAVNGSIGASDDVEGMGEETGTPGQNSTPETEKETSNTINTENGSSAENNDEADAETSEAETETEDEVAVQTLSSEISLDKLKFVQNGIATIESPEQLILLSYCNQKDLQGITININTTGSFDLSVKIESGTDLSGYINSDSTVGTGTGIVADQDYTYQGLGSEDAPFQGTITGQIPQIIANSTIFKVLSSKATVNIQLSITWSGDGSQPMLAQTYVFEDADAHSIPFKFISGQGSLIGTVKASSGSEAGTLTVSNEVSYVDAVKVTTTGSENAGLICNTLESGHIDLNGYVFPKQVTVNAASGAAGTFIGKIDAGTLKLTNISVADNKITNPTVTSTSGCAGGVVGEMSEKASLEINTDLSIEAPSVTGKSVGGFVGKATNISISGQNKITVSNPSVSSGTNKDAYAGGFAGDYIASGDANVTQQLPEQIIITTPKVTTNGGFATNGGNAGGYFGLLELQGALTYQISGTKDARKEIVSEYTAGNGASYGAVAGKVTSTDKKASLIIQNVNINSTNRRQTWYHGGVIGELGGNVYLQTGNVQVTISDTYAKDSACGFGGIVGRLSGNSILSVTDTVKVVISNNGTISQGGGGLVGYADSGSIVELSGVTDLSNVNYNASQYIGQLVGGQNCALVFAHGDGNGTAEGWKFIRSNFSAGSSYVNDIGNYGEIIRLKAAKTSGSQTGLSSTLFNVDETTHELIYGATPSLSGNAITIDSEDTFALLSVAWNSHGVFSPDNNLTNANWGDLKSKNIVFTKDIDLTGTGIIGISRDAIDVEYSGKITGNSKTVTLAIGETFGCKGNNKAVDQTDGCGKIYPTNDNHRYIGLFASSKGSIDDLTITGTINVGSENEIYNNDRVIRVGSIAAQKNAASTILSNVEVSTNIILDAKNTETYSYIGGFYGECAGEYLELKNETKAQTSIKIQYLNGSNDVRTFAGGVIGYTSYGKLKCNGATIGGSVETDAPRYAYVGGLIGLVAPGGADKEPNEWIEIRNLVFDGLKITAPSANIACGGLFGGNWSRTGVYFMGDSDGVDTIGGKDVTKMTVKSATIDAPNASVGGLAYRASGIWEIRSNGIDIQSMTINCGKDLGLLVCHGEKGNVQRGWSVEDGALYLRTTQDWKTAYKVAENLAIRGNNGIFDEIVAYTSASKDSITANNQNGIVSLATTNRVGVAEIADSCTTYQNRTVYGKVHTVNACSRYYYDLDQYIKTAAAKGGTNNGNGKIDTPEELLLWSCYRYASANIKKYFYGYDVGNDRFVNNDLKNDVTTITGDFDMKKYSYYPIQMSTGVTIDDATITFYNQEIENAETSANNKSTKKTTSGTSDIQTQHYMMHCGLFLSHSVTSDAETNISLSHVTFAGSIGKVDAASSGVLFSGTVQGRLNNGKQYPVKLSFKDITLSGLKITDYTDQSYAPLLLNQLGSYTKTEIKELKNEKYTMGTAAASSLIGNVGSADGHQVNMVFSGITLPDKQADGTTSGGIFTHATLLESYKYADEDTSVATYNFYKSGDWTGTNYDHQVTYGKEISDSVEYKDLQKWYYDKENYGESEGEIVDGNNNKNFSSWLPYVCVGYDENVHAHEIKVNQRVFDIVTGCGTYGDPYVITDAGEMEIISEYMITNMPRVDWKITITKDRNQKTYCTDQNKQDITFRYNGDAWIKVENRGEDGEEDWVDAEDGETRTAEFMRHYIANAYYDIQGSKSEMTLKDFKGFGTAENPFRGVLTSSTHAILNLEGANTGNGLITYSYGSVIQNLTLNYQGTGKTLTYQKASSALYPGNCFGGVIGCILGGDNIVDGVKVTMTDGWLTLSGNNKHLLQVGGYAGSICGGGILFRNMSGFTGLTDRMISGGSVSETSYSSLYVNPYVGRVLDGYAFSDTYGQTLNNTDKNYQIQNPTTSGTMTTQSLSASGKTISVNDAKGLLLLSAIVNSGAASSGASNAYLTKDIDNYKFGNGDYGKVRNATYKDIGSSTQTDDFTKSVSDDTQSPKKDNTPYLITTYGTADLFNMAVTSGTSGGAVLVFPSNGQLDMSVYGSSYQSISARYAVSAVASGTGTSAAGIVPLIQGVTGNGTQITLNTIVREYADDDFHAASAGGLFNLLSPSSTAWTVSDLTLTGKTNGQGVVIQYYTSAGAETDVASSSWGYKSNVGVGSFAGSSSGAAASNGWYASDVTFNNVVFKNMTIKSPASAGGLIGNLGRRAPTNRGNNTAAEDVAMLIQPYAGGNGEQTTYIKSIFTNCYYSNLATTGQEAAGGFCGYIDGAVGLQTNLNVTDSSIIVGKDSNITAAISTSCAGGLYGYVRRGVAINDNSETTYTAKWQNVNVTAGQYIGGIIGQMYADNISCTYKINKVEVTGTENNKAMITGTASSGNIYVGGIVGYVTRENRFSYIMTVSACDVKNTQITGRSSSTIYSGGIIGNALIGGNNASMTISTCRVQNTLINNEELSEKNRDNILAGGILGGSNGNQLNISSCLVEVTDIYGSRSGGIIGIIEGIATIKSCTVSGTNNSKNNIKGRRCAAGIIGNVNAGVKVGIHESNVSNMSISCIDDWGAGGLVGDISWTVVPSLYFFDSQIDNCIITGPRAGGLAGDIRGSLNGSNLLLKNTEIIVSTANNAGLLIGLTGNQNLRPMNIAGISIQNTTAKEQGRYVTKLYGTLNNDAENVKKQSYFAFSDYNDTASTSKNGVAPYVVTNPVSDLAVQTTGTGGIESLYGDGASWSQDGTSFTVNAQKIFNDAKGTTTTFDGKYTYQEMGVDSFNFSKNISDYNTNQPGNTITNNFPVLVVADNVSETITNYLDILTNGGYTRANTTSDTTKHVEASVATYINKNGNFVRQSGTSATPSLEVKHDAKGRISEFAATTKYDNTNSQFTLLTVTFTETDENNAAHEYKVQVPIIVRRMLEINFTATLSSGTNYKASNFDAINDNAHLLESTGNPFTAYLTYTYNSDTKGEYSEYGWNSYINAGANVATSLDRKIYFAGSTLPAGTQLSLVDCQNSSKVYYYTITASDSTTMGTKVSLTKFKDAFDNGFESQSIGELMGVTATPDTNGTFIKVDENGKPEAADASDTQTKYNAPTVRVKNSDTYEYYRLKQSNEPGTLYSITVDDNKLKNNANQSTVSENYYLVISVAAIAEGANLNGSIQTDITSDIPQQVSYRTRKGKVEDIHRNTASTYQISQGYKQSLEEKVSEIVKILSANESQMTVDVVDMITVPSGQAFQDQDELYQKFSGSLIKSLTKGTSQTTSAELFPNGTSGTAAFYVYYMNGTNKVYYAYENGTWVSKGNNETKALEYGWTAGNGLMDLPLSTDGTSDNAVSLKSIRTDILKANKTQFYIEVRMQAKLPVNGLEVVPESKLDNSGEPEDYIKLAYTSQLSTSRKSLSYSTNRAMLSATRTKYYRDEPVGAKLTYEADAISQLGINLLDLQHLDTERKNVLIDTTAKYDMSAIKDLSDTLSTSTGIRFKLQLQNKKTVENYEDYNDVLSDLASYIQVEIKSGNSGEAKLTEDTTSYSWTVPKASYWDADKKQLKTSGIFDGEIMVQAIQLKVNITNVEQLQHLYSNYRVVLTAEVIGPNNQAVDNTNASDNIIYTLARINTDFVSNSTANAN